MVFVHKGCTAGVSAAVTVVGSGGSGGSKTFNGGGSGGQMHPESLEKPFTREDELEAEIERLRKGFVWLDDTIEGHLLFNPENKDSKIIQEMKRKISFILSNGGE